MADKVTSILITAALKEEFAAFRGLPAIFLETGMGECNAQKSLADYLKNKKNPSLVICTGFAGALDSALRVGDVIIVKHFFDCPSLSPDPHLLHIVESQFPKLRSGNLIHVKRLICSAGEKKKLSQRIPKQENTVMDMESLIIAKICESNSIPWIVIRCVSDEFHESLPLDFNTFLGENDCISKRKLAFAILTHPKCLKGLLAMRKRAIFCSNHLADCIGPLVNFLEQRKENTGDFSLPG